jgi:prevent-host-death family protein
MRFISVRDLRLRPGEVWKQLKEQQELVVTSKGRPVGVLTDIAGVDIEATLSAIRRAKAELAVSHMRDQATRKQLDQLPTEEIDKEIRSVRGGAKREGRP